MKKWIAILMGVLLVAGVVAVMWPSADPPESGSRAESGRTRPDDALPDFETVEVSSSTPSGLTLTGVVRDPSGQPIANAEVSLASSAQQSLLTVRCSECGQALLSCPAQETRSRVRDLLAAHRGGLTAGATTRTDADGRFRFENLAGVSFTVWAVAKGHGAAVHERAAPGDPVELFLPPERTLVGRVTDERGDPVASAHVHIVSRAVPIPVEVETEGSGAFEARGLGEGPFYVLAEAEGFLPAVAPSVDAGREPVELELIRPRALEVVVQHEGQRVDAEVHLFGDHLQHTATAKDGFTRIDDLWPDEVWVSATAGELSAPPQRVSVTEAVTRVTLELDTAGRLAVTVIDEAGQPVVDPELALSRTQYSEPFWHQRAHTGELVLVGPLAKGSYTLSVTAEGYRATQVPVRVGEGETPVEVVLPKGTFIRGRVLDEYGRPAPRISVLVTPTGMIAMADEQGRFTATVPSPGFYELQAHHSDWGGGELKVTAPADGVELHLEPRAGLRVIVQSGGRRLEGADVAVWQEREAVFRNDRPSGSDGVVLMRGLPPGTYSLIASHPDFLPSARQQVTLKDGELTDAVVELELGAAIEGKVVDETGAPVEGAMVGAIPRRAEPDTTDADGRFELRPLQPSVRFRLEAIHSAYDQKGTVYSIPGGDPVTIVMKKRSVFRGRVMSEDGEPLRAFRIDDQELTSSDGSFEVPLETEAGRVFAVVDAPGYQPHMIDAPADQTDLGTITLTHEAQADGVVVDDSGAPVEGAVVSCDVCDGQVTSDAQGHFALAVPTHLSSFVVMAQKGSLSGTVRTSAAEARSIEVRIRHGVRVTGHVYLENGQPAAGVEVEAVNLDRADAETIVTMQDGSYAVELAEGSYRITLPMASRPFAGVPGLFARFTGDAMTFDIGPSPGAGSLTVHLRPQPSYALWLVKGVVTSLPNPPMELFRSAYAQMVYQPRSETVTLTGIPPGRYTVIYARFHMQSDTGPVMRVVDVPGTSEIDLIGGQP